MLKPKLNSRRNYLKPVLLNHSAILNGQAQF